jgi:hypothetical protein
MSARKLESLSPLTQQHVAVEARQTRLALSPDAVVVRRNGIEFRSASSFAPWTEMTVTLVSPRDSGKVHCNGVVVECRGSRHTGYVVSLLLTGLSRQSQERLNMLAYSSPA